MKKKLYTTLMGISLPEIHYNSDSNIKLPDELVYQSEAFVLDEKQSEPYISLFNDLWQNGGIVNIKDGADEDFKKKYWSWTKTMMCSNNIELEPKRKICAMIFSFLLEPMVENPNDYN
mgnify:CR=1 FL=1